MDSIEVVGCRMLAAWWPCTRRTSRRRRECFQCVMKKPGHFGATNNLALAMCEQGDDVNEQALNYAELNVKTNNNSPDAASTYGWVLYRMGEERGRTGPEQGLSVGRKHEPRLGLLHGPGRLTSVTRRSPSNWWTAC